MLVFFYTSDGFLFIIEITWKFYTIIGFGYFGYLGYLIYIGYKLIKVIGRKCRVWRENRNLEAEPRPNELRNMQVNIQQAAV